MKKIITLVVLFITFSFSSCDVIKNVGSNILTQGDAISGVKELLSMGSNLQNGAFSKDALMAAILPKDVNSVLQKLQQLGLGGQVDKFTNNLTNAVTETATKSGPIFLYGIKQMTIVDAITIVKSGGTAATNYLKTTIGDSLHNAVTPVMRTALNQYNIADEWDKLIGPAKILLGNNAKLNVNLDYLLAGVVTNSMFDKIGEQEIAIRTNAAARTTPTLQKVFGTDWNKTGITQ
ncbi:DUF4197 domain-containing protein [Ferruginibacter albus]|uniref:DUF4197 domain-containing protein n=1 Tax=Ferruginibacter albus TaxID=2875540 RepID=UPI001CC43280|nr:DUF4197 domain-containing protein [Ferruginibacter albus]UAY52569.1 DUF4197 domain-containing protein [Ferruginibacter albus]